MSAQLSDGLRTASAPPTLPPVTINEAPSQPDRPLSIASSSALTDSSSLVATDDEPHHLVDAPLPPAKQKRRFLSTMSAKPRSRSAAPEDYLLDNDESFSHGLSASPSKRHSGVFGAVMGKLHLRNGSFGGGGGGGGGSSGWASTSTAINAATASTSGSTSKISSGKHTPSTSRNAQGDFATFLAAEELRVRLEKEKERAEGEGEGKDQQATLLRSPSGKRRLAKLGSSSGARPVSVSFEKPEVTLEATKTFPGDLSTSMAAAGEGRKAVGKSRSAPSSRPNSRPSSRPPSVALRAQPVEHGTSKPLLMPAVCGAVSDSDSEMDLKGKRPSSGDDDDDDFAVSSGDEEDGVTPRIRDRRHRGSDSSLSDVSETSAILPTLSAPLDSGGGGESSLASPTPSSQTGATSLASGGASRSIDKPLRELEDFELETFLRHFGRHTKEVRVPTASNFSKHRMPRWEDFVINAHEDAMLAARGEKVSVLTHVDQGLRAMAEAEGVKPPERRHFHEKERKKRMAAAKKGKKDAQLTSGTSSGDEVPAAAPTKHISWAKETLNKAADAYDDLDGRADLSERRAKKEEALRRRKKRIDEDTAAAASASAQEDWEVVSGSPPSDRKVDGVAFAIAYILALLERYAPEELDDNPDQAYRESKIRSHIERLYLLAPFWERLARGLRHLYRWEDPKRTAFAAMVYFTLWYSDLIPTAFGLMLMYYVLQYRFFPPSVNILHERVRERMARGHEADRLAERLRRRSRLDVLDIYRRYTDKFGAASQAAAGDIADFHEKVKSVVLWRNPSATWRSLTLLALATGFVTFAPPVIIFKGIFFMLGFTFFILLPLQSYYPRYRRPLSPVWWVLWGAPTDAQHAISTLRRRLEARLEPADGEGGGGGDEARDPLTKHCPSAELASLLAAQPTDSRANQGPGFAKASAKGFLRLEDTVTRKNGDVVTKPRKLGSFWCQHHGVPGHLHVTTRMVYFVALHHVRPEASHKSCKTPLEDIVGLIKTKSLRLFVWSSSGLQIVRKNKGSLFFSNMSHRDEAFNLLLAVGSEGVWSKV